MQKITINRKTYNVCADMERVIRNSSLNKGWAVLADFEGGRGRHRSNAAINAFGARGGLTFKPGFDTTFGIELLYCDNAPEAARKAHPRAQRFVVVTDKRRFNLARKKLAA